MKDIFLFVDMLNCFKVTCFRLTEGLWNLRFCLPNFLKGGITKFSKVGF